MLLLSASALARPLDFEPDLSFQQTALAVPACTPGEVVTWEIAGETTGRSYGNDMETGEDIERDYKRRSSSRLQVRCISSAPLQLGVSPSWEDDAGWHGAEFELILVVTSLSEIVLVEVKSAAPMDESTGRSWLSNIQHQLPYIFPPMTRTAPAAAETWDGAWPIDLGPWWDCHGTVTAGADAAPRSYTLAGRCENISYRGTNRLSGSFTRHDGGFGVVSATWQLSSLWEHYMRYTDTEQVITVTRQE